MALTSQLRNLLAALEAEEAAQKSKSNVHTYTNSGQGSQNITGTKNNSGAYAGDGNSHHISNHHGYSPAINNHGNFHGNGNGGFIGGNFDSSTWNYRI
ncbi:uncharacterized protein LOC109791301 [Cajanus cajan]|uniref:Uncharacterized protein n=1 Tax=Cajanus cajan TaxID=3821 RepID=A0A151QZ86_CAJCA|nr:uncharacterized protein LOC109791301 [Cajanus cajan]KYP35617.1 hypothetical protein KK1_043338 [Cajanus cajan]